MKICLTLGTSDLERILALTQSWQTTYIGEEVTRELDPKKLIDPSTIGDLVLIFTPGPSPLSGSERYIFFDTLSRLVDEYLIAGQHAEAWARVAAELGCINDVMDTRATSETAKRIEGVANEGTLFEVGDKRRHDAARTAARLVFLEVLYARLELLDCDYDRCGRRFIFGTRRRTRFHAGQCGSLFNARLTHRRDKTIDSQNFHRIDIAVGALTVWLLNGKGSWKLAVLIAWSVAEKRTDLRTRLKDYLSRRSNRVPREIGCRLLGKIIDAAVNESNRALTQALIEECGGDSADDVEYVKALLPILVGLVREAEAIQTPSVKADEEARVDAMFRKMTPKRKAVFL